MTEERARVIFSSGSIYRIRTENGEYLSEVSGRFRYDADEPQDFPAAGDFVLAEIPEKDDDRAVITALFPRKTCFIRKSAGREMRGQVAAANVDIVFICMAMDRDFNIRRLERYLTTAWDSGAVPVIVLTKYDLAEDPERMIREATAVSMGSDVVSVSSYLDDFADISRYLQPGKTAAFLGSSGVGKSTLINRLKGREIQRTAETGQDGRGHHTTTGRELIELENGAFVLDTPGMRELGMWDSSDGLERAFQDIEEIIENCRFSDCTHSSEPGCAVLQALSSGDLDRDRWESYLKLSKENAYNMAGSSAAEEKRRKFREISITNKHRRK